MDREEEFQAGENVLLDYGWRHNHDTDIWTMNGVGWAGSTSKRKKDRQFAPYPSFRDITISLSGALIGSGVWEQTYRWSQHDKIEYGDWVRGTLNSLELLLHGLLTYLDAPEAKDPPEKFAQRTYRSPMGFKIKTTGSTGITKEKSSKDVKAVISIEKVRDRARFLIVELCDGTVGLVWFEPGQTPATHHYGTWQKLFPGIDQVLFGARVLAEFENWKTEAEHSDDEVVQKMEGEHPEVFVTELAFDLAYRKDRRERQGDK